MHATYFILLPRTLAPRKLSSRRPQDAELLRSPVTGPAVCVPGTATGTAHVASVLWLLPSFGVK